jgi:predicted O-methyltransferase YrrM
MISSTQSAMKDGEIVDPGIEVIYNGRIRFKGVEGALTRNDALALIAMVESHCLPHDGAMRYAEVGSYLGLSATLVAHACPKARIFTHDLFPLSPEALSEGSAPPPEYEDMLLRFWGGIKRNGLEGVVVPMRGLSAETLRIHEDGSLDVAFVDGDHSVEGTYVDLRLMWSKVKPGGLLLVHDVVVLDDGVTDHWVRQAVKTFTAEQGVTFYDIEGTWGLVAIPKPAESDGEVNPVMANAAVKTTHATEL